MAGKAEKDQETLQRFHLLRQEQQDIASKISELKGEQAEHKLVIDTLKGLDKGRKCFRMVGGVLVERNVGEVLPALESNEAQLGKVLEALHGQLVAKGQELNDYKKKHNIRTKEEQERIEAAMRAEQAKK
eukprot:comp22313_c0_seq1/m.33151 comp22313_c0_seq1/g.33151  ORF comp22313_c0_seq1/g.33151 comp22313_c0_seq1/m.33151 type:complete len:130 (-) comp22313_c0_seq1:733-1122(-)